MSLPIMGKLGSAVCSSVNCPPVAHRGAVRGDICYNSSRLKLELNREKRASGDAECVAGDVLFLISEATRKERR